MSSRLADASRLARALVMALVMAMALAACGLAADTDATPRAPVGAISAPASVNAAAIRLDPPGPGNPGVVGLPDAARPVDTSRPDVVIGAGSPASCTSAAVVAAVARGGVITFDCGPDPVTIAMTATAKVVNTSSIVVLDGGGKVTLSGAGQRRILYMNTCGHAQIWTTSTCQNQSTPQLTIQGLGFTQGNSTGELTDGGGGGAVFVRGGQVRVIDSTFTANRCESVGPDVGGGALRVLSQFEDRPVIVATSTFGAPGLGNTCSNGGAISSIGVSWQIFNSRFIDNTAVGIGANPARPGTPGGGNGGAIALDGNRFTLELAGTIIRGNTAREGGGAVFFVSNNRSGEMSIISSMLEANPSLGFETAGLPGIFFLGARPPQPVDSILT
ncbi:MAG: hypothetical protein NTZ21_10085 [Actinobacteria bacterium]|nr:hypothetical protein [Actinomycetota bacterium]